MSESFNHAVVIVGPAEFGKTTAARSEVAAFLKDHPSGLVLAHDCNVQFKDYCATYEDITTWKRAAAAAAAEKRPMPRGVSVGGNAVELTREAIAIGKRFNSADNTRVPILLVYDESSLMTSSGSSYMGTEDVQLLSNRRHWGIGPVYNVQYPTALTRAFYERATAVYVFSQTSEKSTTTLEEYLGLREGALAEMIQAPPYKYKLWRRKIGLVAENGRAA